MAEIPTQEGDAPFHIAQVDTPCHTHYKIFGDLKSGSTPLIVLHGGPGSGHEYCSPFRKLWSLYGIPVVLYDQVGCGLSTHLRHTAGDVSLWQVDLFVAELGNLIDHLKLNSSDGSGYHLLGHSFGGKVVSDFASRRPSGLRRLVLADSNADQKTFIEGLKLLKKRLSPEAQRAMDEAVAKDDFTDPAYAAAQEEFLSTFLCRADPWPPAELALDFKNQADDPTVRRTMIGVSPWAWNGTLKDWTSIPYLPQINVPTLVYNGEHDTAQYESVVPFFDHIPRVRWITLANASHMPHLDSAAMQEKVMKLVGDFLRQEDKPKA